MTQTTIRPLAEIQKEIHENNKAKGWWDNVNPSDPTGITARIMLVVTELAEAVEEIRKNPNPHHEYTSGPSNKPEGFKVEIADSVIRIMDICESLGIDLELEIAKKVAYNKTRSHRHGGKVL